MNIEQYISSGILESSILGTATPKERKEVDDMVAKYPEIKREFREIEEAINSYNTEHSIAPPFYLKKIIMEKITGKTDNTPIIENHNVKTLKPWLQSPISNYSNWAIAASILLLISIVANVYFITKSGKQDKSISSVNKANNNLSDSLQLVTTNYKQVMEDMSILKDPMYRIVTLKGMKVSPGARAMVCWCPTDKKVYVETDKLPAPPQGMQYQLWAMVDGKPVSEGMLTIGNGLHRMPDIDNAQAFAVTLEKQGGSPTPKGDMYAMGSI